VAVEQTEIERAVLGVLLGLALGALAGLFARSRPDGGRWAARSRT
jgi:hypothetical protein